MNERRRHSRIPTVHAAARWYFDEARAAWITIALDDQGNFLTNLLPILRNTQFSILWLKESVSIHHGLYCTLSWLIDRYHIMSRDELKTLLRIAAEELKFSAQDKALVPAHESDSNLIDLFVNPMHVCAWLAQLKQVSGYGTVWTSGIK